MRIHLPLDLRYSPTAGLVPGMQNPLVGNRAAAMQYEPLSRFPAVRTHDVDELRQRMSGLFSVRWLDLGRGAHNFDGRLNHHQMQDIGVSYARYGCSFEASLSHGHSYLRGERTADAEAQYREKKSHRQFRDLHEIEPSGPSL
jgi:hypothetical protein